MGDESLDDATERVRLMASDVSANTYDLSPNDRSALRAVMDALDARARLIPPEMGPDELMRISLDRAWIQGHKAGKRTGTANTKEAFADHAREEVIIAARMLLMVAGDDTDGLDETEARCVADLKAALSKLDALSKVPT